VWAKKSPPSERRPVLLIAKELEYQFFVTRKGTLLDSLWLGVSTLTVPVVAPAGTVVLISDFETTVNFAAVPLKRTLVVPAKFVPRIMTLAPILPDVGRVVTEVGGADDVAVVVDDRLPIGIPAIEATSKGVKNFKSLCFRCRLRHHPQHQRCFQRQSRKSSQAQFQTPRFGCVNQVVLLPACVEECPLDSLSRLAVP